MQNPLDWDSSYHDLLKEIRRIPINRYAARRMAWEDYVENRVNEILGLAREHPDETNVFDIATMQGESLKATVTVTAKPVKVDASVWRGEHAVFECTGAQEGDARVGMTQAVTKTKH